MKQKLSAYWRLMRMDKPIGSLLLLWPCLMALFFAAGGVPDFSLIVIFTLGVFIMRACGCVINDYADRKVDGKVKRTQNRPLASGELTSKEALGLFGMLALLAFGLVLFLNTLVLKLAVVGIILTVIYPFLKRVTNLPQLFLGIVFSWSIPMAYAAVNGELPAQAWWLFFGNWCWIVAYDTMYAMVDRDDDLKIGVKSTAILFGDWDKFIIGVLQVFALFGFAMAGHQHGQMDVYLLGLLAFIGFGVYQQYLIKDRDRQNCFKAFLNNNWAGLAMFIALVVGYLL
ncbi:4-hydroxybenzoate octaprenyltransferase [Parashewanella tropica]|uniref:4-hydroxybenzoate octaprenyltransferase n=1 Tax=Parashewanella tropica TaxID=2547970 RepID=UPI00105A4CA7|nr:4-hydroxybenzoate octaprenyltransferase [Parashewanella tropica]